MQSAGNPPLYADPPARSHCRDLSLRKLHESHWLRESNWTPWHHFSPHDLPTAVRPWLLDSGSLTRRLVRASGEDFKVRVISHSWQRPRHSEAKLLDMGSRELGIVREVTLQCHNQPWVFARSVIPARSISGQLRRLRKFADSSLGELLFSDPSMRRHPFELAVIDGDDPQLPATLRQERRLWGRRCRFELAGKPIMVSEIFLPTFRP